MRAMAMAEQLDKDEDRRWALFWLGGLSRSEDNPFLPLLDLILEGRVTFTQARRADVVLQLTGVPPEA